MVGVESAMEMWIQPSQLNLSILPPTIMQQLYGKFCWVAVKHASV